MPFYCREYFRRWFFIDLLSTIPYDAIYFMLENAFNFEMDEDHAEIKYIRLLELLKIFRLVRVIRYLTRFQEVQLKQRFKLQFLRNGSWCVKFVIFFFNRPTP